MPNNKIWIGSDGNLNTNTNYSATGVPASGDSLRVPVTSGNLNTNLNTLSNSSLSGALATVIFEDGCAMTVGSNSAPMKFTCTRFDGIFSGGQQYFDLEASNTSIRLHGGSGGTGQFGTYVKGSALQTVDIEGGYVAIAGLSFETATVVSARIMDASSNVFIGEGVTLTTLENANGTVDLRCAATTVSNYGTLSSWGTGAITTVNMYDGKFVPESSGTITNLNVYGGVTDLTSCGIARTITNLNPIAGGSGVVLLDTSYVTVTNFVLPSNTKLQLSFG